ncbi:hypothetical protein Lepil_1515 [Leptonema illini DSM 21528]|uniref:Uncharacterized protein n=2 Tax=Leptonema illini TaxID=183 RepID=H2CKX0_9LEPT|nr:hypothetical protein [Leptonema illini]EHQ06204.1 hypothetical protein Lepil_1515 [Leptonema illini DSM 21528]
MKAVSLDTNKVPGITQKLRESSLGALFLGQPLNSRRLGAPPGSKTKEAFAKNLRIAQDHDTLLNCTFGSGFVAANLATQFDKEVILNGNASLYSDLLVHLPDRTSVRVEFMWRKSATAGAIAQYVLEKLNLYGKALSYF